MASYEAGILENGDLKASIKEIRSIPSSSLRKRSDLVLVKKVPCGFLRQILSNLQEVLLGTKLSILFPAIPLAIVAHCYQLERPWVFALSLLGLTPLAERLSFLTEQIVFYTGPTVGGLLNATCGNATELIIALLALKQGKIEVVKCSLLGSILSNLLLVLGSSLLCGGLTNLNKEQKYDKQQANVNSGPLLLGLLCQLLPLIFKYADSKSAKTSDKTLHLARASSIVMLLCYAAYLFFQLKTHPQLFEVQQEDGEDDEIGSKEEAVIGFPSALVWLAGMTAVIALLSNYVVGTIEDVSETWGLSVSFMSIILLPIVGNAAEHASAVIFASKDKLDISLSVALGSATQIATFVIPLSVIVAWIMGINMDLVYNALETGSFFSAVLLTTFTLQDGTSQYLKGLVLILCYIVIGASFFLLTTPPLHQKNVAKLGVEAA